MSSLAQQTVHAGHTIKFKIDGQEIGRAQSINGQRSFGQQGVYELGTIMPAEYVALQYQGQVTLSKFKVRKKSLKDLGLASLGIGILNMDVIDIEVTDRFTGDIIVVYRGCSLNDYSETFQTNAISGEDATWVYLSADEGTPEAIDTSTASTLVNQ